MKSKSLFDAATMPSNEVEAYVYLSKIMEELGVPSELVIAKSGNDTRVAVVYKDVEGESVHAELPGFSLEKNSQGRACLESFLIIANQANSVVKSLDTLQDGVHRIQLASGELVTPKDNVGEEFEFEVSALEVDAESMTDVVELAEGDVQSEISRLATGQKWVAVTMANDQDSFPFRRGDLAEITAVENKMVEVKFSGVEESFIMNKDEFVKAFAYAECDDTVGKVIRGGKVANVKLRARKKLAKAQQEALRDERRGVRKSSRMRTRKKSCMESLTVVKEEMAKLVGEILQTSSVADLRKVFEASKKSVVKGGKVVGVKRKLGRVKMASSKKAALTSARAKMKRVAEAAEGKEPNILGDGKAINPPRPKAGTAVDGIKKGEPVAKNTDAKEAEGKEPNILGSGKPINPPRPKADPSVSPVKSDDVPKSTDKKDQPEGIVKHDTPESSAEYGQPGKW